MFSYAKRAARYNSRRLLDKVGCTNLSITFARNIVQRLQIRYCSSKDSSTDDNVDSESHLIESVNINEKQIVPIYGDSAPKISPLITIPLVRR